MNIQEFVLNEIRDSVETKQKLLNDAKLLKAVTDISNACIDTYKKGGKTIFAGNGGSAADAQHLAAEFVSRFYFDRPGLASLSLSVDPSAVTAIANDYGYEYLFSRQIEAHGRPGDIFFGISTSGKSPNVLRGIQKAKELKMLTVAFTSEKGIEMAQSCDFAIVAPSTCTPRIQECHILIGHAICAAVEEVLFKQFKK